MCGRFALDAPSEKLVKHFNLTRKVSYVPRYNIAPSQPVIIIHAETHANDLAYARWGLIPHWAKDEKIGSKLTNARAETVNEKPSFRAAFKSRRCLIPATGFYEWKHEGKNKYPYFIQMKKGSLFAFAGIWESWQSPSGERVTSCAIITTVANSIGAEIHNRMPVILEDTSYDYWLDPVQSPQALQEMLKPYTSDRMHYYKVSSRVNNVKNDSIECIKKAD